MQGYEEGRKGNKWRCGAGAVVGPVQKWHFNGHRDKVAECQGGLDGGQGNSESRLGLLKEEGR